MDCTQQAIADFLRGDLSIVDFRHMYDEIPEIDAFLQKIIDDMKENPQREVLRYPFVMHGRTLHTINAVPYLLAPETDPGLEYCPPQYESVHQCLTYEFRMKTHDVETAAGALAFYDVVYSIYYQIDQSIPYCYRYFETYGFALKVIPDYLAGGESEKYIQKNIIPLFPDSMKKTDRIKAIRAKIREIFKSEKGYPCWAQASEWPMDQEGKPCTYLGKGKRSAELERFCFRDETTQDEIVIEQYY